MREIGKGLRGRGKEERKWIRRKWGGEMTRGKGEGCRRDGRSGLGNGEPGGEVNQVERRE